MGPSRNCKAVKPPLSSFVSLAEGNLHSSRSHLLSFLAFKRFKRSESPAHELFEHQPLAQHFLER